MTTSEDHLQQLVEKVSELRIDLVPLATDLDAPYSLYDVHDQHRINEDMKKDLPSCVYKHYTCGRNGFNGIFHHVDNIRYVYNESGLSVPEWFKEKYGAFLVKEDIAYNSLGEPVDRNHTPSFRLSTCSCTTDTIESLSASKTS